MSKTKSPADKPVSQIRKEATTHTSPAAEQELSNARGIARVHLADRTVEGMLSALATASVEVGTVLAGVAERIRGLYATEEHLRVAIKEKEDRLNNLHDIEVMLVSLEQIVADHDAKVKELAQSRQLVEEACTEEIRQLRAKVQAESAEYVETARRERANYEYQLAQERTRERDAYEQQKKVRDREDEAARADIKAAQAEIAELRIAASPETIAKIVKEKVEATVSAVQQQNRHEWALREARYQSDLALANQAKAVLEQQLKMEATEVKRLQEMNAGLQDKVQSIAVEAVKGASGQRALEEVRGMSQQMAQNNIKK